jgi:hypothetical protein
MEVIILRFVFPLPKEDFLQNRQTIIRGPPPILWLIYHYLNECLWCYVNGIYILVFSAAMRGPAWDKMWGARNWLPSILLFLLQVVLLTHCFGQPKFQQDVGMMWSTVISNTALWTNISVKSVSARPLATKTEVCLPLNIFYISLFNKLFSAVFCILCVIDTGLS